MPRAPQQPMVTALDAIISETHVETTIFQDGKPRLRIAIKEGALVLDWIGRLIPNARAAKRIHDYFSLFVKMTAPAIALNVIKAELVEDAWSVDDFIAMGARGPL